MMRRLWFGLILLSLVGPVLAEDERDGHGHGHRHKHHHRHQCHQQPVCQPQPVCQQQQVPQNAGYSPTVPYSANVRWQLPPGMTVAEYQRIQAGYYNNAPYPYNSYAYPYANAGYNYDPYGSSPQWNMNTLSPDIPGYREPSPFSR